MISPVYVVLIWTGLKDSLCSKLKAVRQQQTVKFTNTKYSGVVATQCARHNFYLAQGIVNLVKGETYVSSATLSTVPEYVIAMFTQTSHLGVHSELKLWINAGS